MIIIIKIIRTMNIMVKCDDRLSWVYIRRGWPVWSGWASLNLWKFVVLLDFYFNRFYLHATLGFWGALAVVSFFFFILNLFIGIMANFVVYYDRDNKAHDTVNAMANGLFWCDPSQLNVGTIWKKYTNWIKYTDPWGFHIHVFVYNV